MAEITQKAVEFYYCNVVPSHASKLQRSELPLVKKKKHVFKNQFIYTL